MIEISIPFHKYGACFKTMNKRLLPPEQVLFILLNLTPLAMILSRNIATPILAIGAVFVFGLLWREGLRPGSLLQERGPATRAAGVIGACLIGLMALSLVWSPVPERGGETTLHLAGNAIMLAIAAVGVWKGFKRNRSTAAFPCFLLLVTGVLILIELRFGSPVRSLLGGTTEAFRMNRGAVALVLFLPLALYYLPATAPARGFAILTIGVSAIAVFLSESESAKLSFVVLPIAYLLARVLGRYAIAVFGFGVLASLALAPLLAFNLNNLIPDFLSENISYGTLGIRADMWAEFANLIWFKPILGHGMEASHVARDTYGHLLANDRVLGFGHAHNFAVQVWYELGLVGVLLFSALIILFFRSLNSLPARAVPPVLATVSAIWTVSLVSHGAWQAWWWSLMGIITLLWLMVLQRETEASPVQL